MAIVSTNRIAFLGTPIFAAEVLRILAASPYRPGLVVTEPNKPVGRKQIVTPPATKLAARELNIEVAQPGSHTELLKTLAAFQPDLVIVAAYGRILRKAVIDLPRHGVLNIHASLLPKYRGASPIQAAILTGDPETGVSIMQIDEGLDTGPVIAQQAEPIFPNDTTPTLSHRLADVGAHLLIDKLEEYLAGHLSPAPQDHDRATVTGLITKNAGRIDGTQTPTKVLRMLRAYSPWPGVWFEIDGQRILLLAAHELAGRLIPDQLQLAGKNPVAWGTFCRDRADLAQKIEQKLNTK